MKIFFHTSICVSIIRQKHKKYFLFSFRQHSAELFFTLDTWFRFKYVCEQFIHAVLFVALFIAVCLNPKSGQFKIIAEQLLQQVSIFYCAAELCAVFNLISTQSATRQMVTTGQYLLNYFCFFAIYKLRKKVKKASLPNILCQNLQSLNYPANRQEKGQKRQLQANFRAHNEIKGYLSKILHVHVVNTITQQSHGFKKIFTQYSELY